MQLLHGEFYSIDRSKIFFPPKLKKILFFLVAWLADAILIAKDQLVIAY